MAEPFNTARDAALALLATFNLSEKEGQFCGGLAFRTDPLTPKQSNWLAILLKRNSLPPVEMGGGI